MGCAYGHIWPQVLRFTALWDDRDKLYGDLLTFRIHYFLADDTIEVRGTTIHCTRTREGSMHPSSVYLERKPEERGARLARQEQREKQTRINQPGTSLDSPCLVVQRWLRCTAATVVATRSPCW